jgi:hypothetical protein
MPDRLPLPELPGSALQPEWLKVRLAHGRGDERVERRLPIHGRAQHQSPFFLELS